MAIPCVCQAVHCTPDWQNNRAMIWLKRGRVSSNWLCGVKRADFFRPKIVIWHEYVTFEAKKYPRLGDMPSSFLKNLTIQRLKGLLSGIHAAARQLIFIVYSSLEGCENPPRMGQNCIDTGTACVAAIGVWGGAKTLQSALQWLVFVWTSLYGQVKARPIDRKKS